MQRCRAPLFGFRYVRFVFFQDFCFIGQLCRSVIFPLVFLGIPVSFSLFNELIQ